MTAEAASAVSIGPVRGALIVLLVAVGVAFLVVGTVGLLRLPDVYNRMHATSKATTLGAASIALAAFVFYGPGGDGLIGLVTVVFLFVTAPTGAHMISQAAHRMGVGFYGGVEWPGEGGGERAEEVGQDGSETGSASPGDD
ncbi:cation:proton antiporter [Salinigranum rubrum]|uniref:Cation:proton antiporter n=1 Tax=Salinigranum rubrum TaxID=755307 RepID=A0A2I8VHJ6_9EURY|nr:monovalent cation/H(+) antiporter subunit G [Salinigranum rubrum]AUV81406.1 cation:proton antiporter [Salinigranum rubrum]